MAQDSNTNISIDNEEQLNLFLRRWKYLPGLFKPFPNFPKYPNNVFLGAIPKTGTTWMQQIVHQIRTGGDESFEHIHDVVPTLLQSISLEDHLATQQNYDMHVFKSHLNYDDAIKYGGKHIITLRDPVDTFWSMYKFAPALMACPPGITVHDFYYHSYAIPNLSIVDFNKCLLSWWDHRNDNSILLVPYEDLKEDLSRCIDKISEFLQINLTPNQKALVHHYCTYKYMATEGSKDKFGQGPTIRAIIPELTAEEKALPTSPKVRPDGGTVGQGGQHVPPDIVADIQRRWTQQITPVTGCKNYEQLRLVCSLLKSD